MNQLRETVQHMGDLEAELRGARTVIAAICRQLGRPVHLSDIELGLIPKGVTLVAEPDMLGGMTLRVVETRKGEKREDDRISGILDTSDYRKSHD